MSSSRPTNQPLLSDTVVLWLVGAAFAALHIATSSQYGFHRDELLSYSNAIHLDWCYVVYPPVSAWLARLELILFGTSLVRFRPVAAVSVGLVAVLAGLMARAFGGNGRCQPPRRLAADRPTFHAGRPRRALLRLKNAH